MGALQSGSNERLSINFWHLKKFNVFETFERDELESVTKVLHLQEFKRGEPIHLPDQTERRLYFSIRGRAKLSRVDDGGGKELILYIVKPGEMFGLLAFAREQYLDTRVVALEKCIVGHISEPDFNVLMQKNPDVGLRLNKVVGKRLIKIEHRLEELLFRDVPCRLARLLLRLVDEYEVELPCGSKIDLKLTQQDIANLIGATREMVSLSLNDFKRSGWIAMHRHHVCVHDRQALKKMAA